MPISPKRPRRLVDFGCSEKEQFFLFPSMYHTCMGPGGEAVKPREQGIHPRGECALSVQFWTPATSQPKPVDCDSCWHHCEACWHHHEACWHHCGGGNSFSEVPSWCPDIFLWDMGGGIEVQKTRTGHQIWMAELQTIPEDFTSENRFELSPRHIY